MIRMVYVITAMLGMTNSDLAEMMSVAGKCNAALSITGRLAYNVRNVTRALEGVPNNVLDFIKSISREDRHTGVIRNDPTGGSRRAGVSGLVHAPDQHLAGKR